MAKGPYRTDAWLNAYDCAVIVSNDSDLAESLRLVPWAVQYLDARLWI